MRYFPAFLPTCVQAYKESVLEPMLQGSDKTPALINDYKEYHTDTTVKFMVRMSEEKLAQAEAAGIHKVFKLQSSLTCNSMVNRSQFNLKQKTINRKVFLPSVSMSLTHYSTL